LIDQPRHASGANCDHPTDGFMPEDTWRRFLASALDRVEVGAADGGTGDRHQQLTRAAFRQRKFCEFQRLAWAFENSDAGGIHGICFLTTAG